MLNRPKICILFSFRDGPWGGGNQLLCSLRDRFRARSQWSDTPDGADVVLFNSFNDAAEVVTWKRRLPNIPFVHRIDGPISIYRGRDFHVDQLIHDLATSVADGVVFQSCYSRDANRHLGMPDPPRSTVIMNAPDATLFHPDGRVDAVDAQIRIVATSWSSNWRKGFEIYRYLDETLDFARFSMVFVGNSPVSFRHIRHIPPQDPAGVAAILRDSDIFLTASQDESCSNALAEAIACGLVPVAHRSGGQPEQVGAGGILFDGLNDVMEAIEMAAAELSRFRAALPRLSVESMADAYAAFLTDVWRDARPPHRLSRTGALGLRLRLVDAWARGKAAGLSRRFGRLMGE